MWGRPSPLVLKSGCRLAMAVLLSPGLPGTALPQMASAPPPEVIDPRGATREVQQREAGLRSAGMVVSESKDPRLVQAAVEQVKQDFKRLQVLRNDLARRVKADHPLDYKSLAEKTAEINKRASRLKTLLMLYPRKDDESAEGSLIELDSDKMPAALVILCKTIDRFVESPVFNLQGVVDVQQSARAGGDLLNIIKLSASIKKGAERLTKVPK